MLFLSGCRLPSQSLEQCLEEQAQDCGYIHCIPTVLVLLICIFSFPYSCAMLLYYKNLPLFTLRNILPTSQDYLRSKIHTRKCSVEGKAACRWEGHQQCLLFPQGAGPTLNNQDGQGPLSQPPPTPSTSQGPTAPPVVLPWRLGQGKWWAEGRGKLTKDGQTNTR